MGETVNIPVLDFKHLVESEQKIKSLVAYLRNTAFADKKICGDILGFDVEGMKEKQCQEDTEI